MARYLIENEDIISTIEGGLASRFWNTCSELGVDVNITLDNDGTPHIDVNTNSDNIRIRVTTHNLFDDNDDIIGYQFNPVVITRSTKFDFDQDNVISEFDKMKQIAELAEEIYMTEVEFDEE